MSALVCPICGTSGRLDESLLCQSCGSSWEFGEDRRLRAASESTVCPCGTRNPPTRPDCEGCGRVLQERCPLCGSLHPLGRRVCPRLGQVLPRRGPARSLLALAGILLVALATWTFAKPPAGLPGPGPRLDVVFVLDATGSMGDEIDAVKQHLRSMIARFQAGSPVPRVRFGLVAYRDHGDEFLTRVLELSEDPGRVEAAVRRLEADGGGDTPEAVAEALHAAIHQVGWDLDPATSRMLFLIGDAAPHQDLGLDFRSQVRAARARGIRVHALGCSGIQDSGEAEFREVADLGEGRFEFLTYRQEVVRPDGSAGHVLYQGGTAYEASDEDASWRRGASRLMREGKARAVPATSAGPVPAAAGDLQNNLDSVLTESVMDEARKMGVSY